MDRTEEALNLIQQALATAEKAPEPGSMTLGELLHREEGLPPATISDISSKGYVYVYDIRTRERYPCHWNMLPAQLQKRDPETRELVFTTVRPDEPPYRGSHMCILHKDDPGRAHYNELGLAVCKKDNLRSPYEARRHAMKKHPAEWAVIEEERAARDREEERAFRKALLER